MGQNELLAKLTELKELKNMAEELTDAITAIEDQVKAEMTERDTDKLIVGPFKVSWAKVQSKRFDSSAFKTANAELYGQFCKTVETRRFSVA